MQGGSQCYIGGVHAPIARYTPHIILALLDKAKVSDHFLPRKQIKKGGEIIKDLTIKRFIIANKLDKQVRNYRYQIKKMYDTTGCINDLEKIESNIFGLDADTNRVIHNLNNNRYYRIKKAKDFISNYIFGCANDILIPQFITFTFNDKTLNSTSELARHKRIKLLIKKYCASALLNIDFGAINEREHYHAVVLATLENVEQMRKKAEKNGFVYNQKIRNKPKDMERLSKYLNKLTYHAIKDTTQHDNSAYRSYYYNTFDKISQPMI